MMKVAPSELAVATRQTQPETASHLREVAETVLVRERARQRAAEASTHPSRKVRPTRIFLGARMYVQSIWPPDVQKTWHSSALRDSRGVSTGACAEERR